MDQGSRVIDDSIDARYDLFFRCIASRAGLPINRSHGLTSSHIPLQGEP